MTLSILVLILVVQAGYMLHVYMNRVNGLAHHKSLVAWWVSS